MNTQENYIEHAIIDRQHEGLAAAAFAHPDGWQAESQVFWNFQNANQPAVFVARAANMEKQAAFEFLPLETFSWTQPETGFYFRGQNVGGVINLPPMPGVDALVQLIVPKYRGNRQNLRVLAAETVPTQAKPHAQIPPQNIQAHKIQVKIEYRENDRAFVEEFACIHTVVQFPPVSSGWGMSSVIGWALTDLCCYRAAPENFDALRPTFAKIQNSLRINPQFVELAQKYSQMLLQNSAQMANDSINAGWEMLRASGEASRQFIERGQQYINRQQERIDSMYNTPPPVYDQTTKTSHDSEYGAHEQFIDSLREEQTIHNPENTANEKISNHHDYVWKDDFGNTFGTDDPNYDPNPASNRSWTRAVKKRVGD